jgi:uncharacterized protein (TIGR03792 family)
MVIEWLKIKVAAELRQDFIAKDAAIWTPVLARCSGFLGKEVWIDRQFPDQVIFVIRWQTKEQWQAIPPDYLATTELLFNQQFPYPNTIIEAQEFQVQTPV